MLGTDERGRAGARHRRDGDRWSPCSRRATRGPSRSCCARTAPATWAGSRRRTARSTRRNTAGTSRSRRWSAKITAEFIENFDAKRERCWIAEMDGERVGSAFVVRKTDDDGEAASALSSIPRRAGWGSASAWSTSACALRKSAGYKSMTLWTQDYLYAARGIYERAGFKLVASRSRTTRSASISSAKPGSASFEPLGARRARRRRDRRAGRRRDRGDALCGGRHLARLARLPALCHWRCLPCAGGRDGHAACALRAPTSCRSRRSASASSAS